MTAPAPPTSMQSFQGRNGRFANAQAIHAVAPQAWIGGKHVPGPACHTPSGTFDPRDFVPVRRSVTCRRCLKRHQNKCVDPPDDPGLFELPAPTQEAAT